ncbi:Protein lin-41 [Clarias magur]|uniref:Protein lin-41 n=1 Tax=Clarias magur TaxID=1594786 RepID=A0A8J4UTX4_CLAMG|nr:Protein lin-41 [Clarias magur]
MHYGQLYDGQKGGRASDRHDRALLHSLATETKPAQLRTPSAPCGSLPTIGRCLSAAHSALLLHLPPRVLARTDMTEHYFTHLPPRQSQRSYAHLPLHAAHYQL